MVTMQPILKAFSVLEQKCSKNLAPRYALLETDGRLGKVSAMLFRGNGMEGKDIRMGETMELFFLGSPSEPHATITWEMNSHGGGMFGATLKGDPAGIKKTCWFLHQELRVRAGSHILSNSTNGISNDGKDWDTPADTVFLVRCGFYTKDGVKVLKKPSQEAFSWLYSEKALLSRWVKDKIAREMRKPDPDGYYTIRRVL